VNKLKAATAKQEAAEAAAAVPAGPSEVDLLKDILAALKK
jgi:hypothetical protein